MVLPNSIDLGAKLDVPTKIHSIGQGRSSESNQVQLYELSMPNCQARLLKEVKVV